MMLSIGVARGAPLHFPKITLHSPNCRERQVRIGLPPQPTYKPLILKLFLSFNSVEFGANLRRFLTRTRVQTAAETNCARYVGASDGENLCAAIWWFTFLLQ